LIELLLVAQQPKCIKMRQIACIKSRNIPAL